MNVKKLRKILKKLNPKYEVTITDGYKGLCYSGDFHITYFENTVDIGIGGLEELENINLSVETSK